MFYIFSFIFISSLLKFSLNFKFLLINLLSLEILMLIIFFMLFFYLNFFCLEMFFLMVFLVFSVCEGVLGISLLILMIRNYSNNYFQSLSSLQC